MPEGIDRVAGINIGKKEEPLEPALKALSEHNVYVNPMTISRLRGGSSSAAEILHRLACAATVTTTQGLLKDALYLRIALTGIYLREKQTRNTTRTHRYNSLDFTPSIASTLHLRPVEITHLFKAMRVDMIMAEQKSNLPPSFLGVFQITVDHYLDDYTTPPKYAQKTAEELRRRWNPKTIANFYQQLYSLNGAQTTASFATYEVEFVEEFYKQQILAGSPLTSFDRLILEKYLAKQIKNREQERRVEADIAKEVTALIGVKAGTDVTLLHRNTLVYGRPTRNLIFH